MAEQKIAPYGITLEDAFQAKVEEFEREYDAGSMKASGVDENTRDVT